MGRHTATNQPTDQGNVGQGDATDTPPLNQQSTDNDSQSQVDPDIETLGEGGKKALVAERKARKEAENRLKELEPLADELRKRQEAEKTESQRSAEALTAERDARARAETNLLRYTIGADKGVPAKLIKFLTGTTKEEIEQAADELLAEVGANKPVMPGRPTERMANGQPSASGLDDKDPMALIAMGRGQTPTK